MLYTIPTINICGPYYGNLPVTIISAVSTMHLVDALNRFDILELSFKHLTDGLHFFLPNKTFFF